MSNLSPSRAFVSSERRVKRTPLPRRYAHRWVFSRWKKFDAMRLFAAVMSTIGLRVWSWISFT